MSQEIPLISNSWSNDPGQIWKTQHLTKELSCRNHIKSQILETVLGQFEKMPPIFHILNSVGGWITYIHVTTISQHFGGLTFLTSCKGRQVYRGHLGRISSTVWPGATATTTGFCLLEACCWRVYSQSYLSYKTHSFARIMAVSDHLLTSDVKKQFAMTVMGAASAQHIPPTTSKLICKSPCLMGKCLLPLL